MKSPGLWIDRFGVVVSGTVRYAHALFTMKMTDLKMACAGNKLKWDSGKETFCQKIRGRREDNEMGQLYDLSKC